MGRQTIIRPVILCGGAGTRLWPVSRAQFPKHLLPVTGEQSLLQETAARLSGELFEPAIVVGAEDQGFLIKRQLQEAGAALEAVILEPVGRNTSAAAALAAGWLQAAGRNELMLLMPSDHVIRNRQAFLDAIAIAVPHAQQGAIVTFGAQPTEPNTQYGYIEVNGEQAFADGALPIVRFHEKPSAERASEYVASGHFFWNCGIFLAKASTVLDEMRHFLPASLSAVTRSLRESATDGLFVRPAADAFADAANISIDNGIMEKTGTGVVVPVQMDWSDVGAWNAVWKLGDKDGNDNVTHGNVVAVDTRKSLLRADGRALLTTVGVDNMVVIAVSDAIFVAPMDRASEVKDLIARLEQSERDYTTLPPKVARPWGSYEAIAEGPRFKVRHMTVDPGESLSLTSDCDQSAHWVIISGSAEVTLGERLSLVGKEESIHIPAGTKRRLVNPGTIPLELVEVQCGPRDFTKRRRLNDE